MFLFLWAYRALCALQNLKKSEILGNHIEVLKAKIHVLFWDFEKMIWPIYEAIVGPLKFLYIFWNFRAQWYDIESNRRGCNILVFATNTTNYSTRKWRRGNQFRLIHHNAIFLLKWAFLALYNAVWMARIVLHSFNILCLLRKFFKKISTNFDF